MHELDLLIVYWQTNLALNYVTRTPATNDKIRDTIKYLTELRKLKGVLN